MNILTVCQTAEAHTPDVDFRNALTRFNNAEGDLGPAVTELNRLDSLQREAYSEWETASDKARNDSIGSFKSIGQLNYVDFMEKATDAGVALWESQSLESALTSCIEAAQAAYTKAKRM